MIFKKYYILKFFEFGKRLDFEKRSDFKMFIVFFYKNRSNLKIVHILKLFNFENIHILKLVHEIKYCSRIPEKCSRCFKFFSHIPKIG
jgi:hypothetical protein